MCLVSRSRCITKGMLCEGLEKEMVMIPRHQDGFTETKSCQTNLISFLEQDYLCLLKQVQLGHM